MKKNKILLLVLVLGLVFLGLYLFLGSKNAKDIFTTVSKTSNSLVSNIDNLPFKEITIPYLRERDYKSELGEMNKYSETSTYTSYLASYDSDGFKVNGLLTVPKGDKPTNGWPAIVFVHGYIPPTLYNTTSQYADYVDYLARSGFVVFKIDLRGHGNSEGEAGGGYFGADYIIDTLNAKAALETSSFVNSKNIGLWGHSMAGNVVMRSFAARPTIPAVVIWAGAVYTYVDQREYGINDQSYRPPQTNAIVINRRQALFDKVGSPSAQSDFWKQMAPTTFLNDLKGVIQIHHAVDDSVVSIEYSRNLVSLLDKTKVPHQLFEYPTGGHNISGVSFNLAMQRTVDFFKSHLNQ